MLRSGGGPATVVLPRRRRQRADRVHRGVIALGTLIGWAVGNFGYGLAFGAVVGIPVGVAATVIKYRNV